MSTITAPKQNWREKSASRFKKKVENFYGFTDEATTFDDKEVERQKLHAQREIELKAHIAPSCDAATPPASSIAFFEADDSNTHFSLDSQKIDSKNSLDSSLDSSKFIHSPSLDSLNSAINSFFSGLINFDPILDSLKIVFESQNLGLLDSQKIDGKNSLDSSRQENILVLSNDAIFLKTEVKVLKEKTPSSLDSSTDANKIVKDSYKIAKGSRLGSALDSQRVANKIVHSTMSEVIEFLPLLRKKVLFLLFQYARQNGSRETGKVEGKKLASLVNTSYGSFKDVILKLREQNLISIASSSRGNGGYSNYEIQRDCFEHLIVLEKLQKLSIDSSWIVDKAVDKIVAEPNYSSSSDSSFGLKNGNEDVFNKGIFKFVIPQTLKELGVESEHFTTIVAKKKFSLEVIQNSINAFAFDLDNGKHRKTQTGNPLDVLFGVLQKGIPYTSVAYLDAKEDSVVLYESEIQEKYEELKKRRWLESLKVKFLEFKKTNEYQNTIRNITSFMKDISDEQAEKIAFLEFQDMNSLEQKL